MKGTKRKVHKYIIMYLCQHSSHSLISFSICGRIRNFRYYEMAERKWMSWGSWTFAWNSWTWKNLVTSESSMEQRTRGHHKVAEH